MVQKHPPEVFCKKGFLSNFVKLTGKQLCQSLFFNKVAGLRLKRDSDFPVNFAKFLRTLIFTEHLRTTASDGFDTTSPQFLLNYLSEREQKTKMDYAYSERWIIIGAITQWLIFGPLLFKVFIKDLFSFVSNCFNTCSFADGNTLYSCAKVKVNILGKNLKSHLENAFSWFDENSLKLNFNICSLVEQLKTN